jgi:hypothetical protein
MLFEFLPGLVACKRIRFFGCFESPRHRQEGHVIEPETTGPPSIRRVMFIEPETTGPALRQEGYVYRHAPNGVHLH